MRRDTLFFFALCLALTGLGICREEPSPSEQADSLDTTIAALDPSDFSPAAERLRLDYAKLLTFTLERDFSLALGLTEPLLERALAVDPPDETWLAEIEHTLAHTRFYLGHPANEVEPLLLSALARRRALFGDNHPEVLHTRSDIAIYYGRTGQPDRNEAESRAVALAFEAINPDSDDTLQARTTWSVSLGWLGRWTETETLLRDVLARRTALLGPDDISLTEPLNLLCWVLFSTDRFTEAVPLMERIVDLRITAYGDNATKTLTARYNLASLYERTGRLAEAEAIIRTDLKRSLTRTDPGWHGPATYHERLGDLALRQGDTATSVREYEQALTVYRQPASAGWNDEDTRTLEKTLYAYARAQTAAGHLAAARLTAAEALDLLAHEFQRRLGYTSETERLSFAAQERPFDLPATLGDAPLLARTVVRFQGLILESLIEDAALVAQLTDPSVPELLAAYRAALAAPAMPANPSHDPLALSPLDRLEKELTTRLGGSHLPRRALSRDPAAVLVALPANAALVNYVRYRPLRPTDDATGDESRARYLALIGQREAGWQIIDLGLATEIDDLVERYQILTINGGPVSWADELRVKVLDPIRSALPSKISRLYVVPDGALHRVNFASLPEADGGSFAIQRHEYVWLDSARELIEEKPPRAPGRLGPIRVIGAPTLTGELAVLPALPGAAAEAAIVQNRLPEAVVLTGDEATPEAALATPIPRILHIAAHGLWTLDGADHRAALTRSGIALAGPQGFLSAARLAASDLAGTELVVISACNSGGGPVAAGEGVLGLRRALARAGAQHVLVALWPLDDAAAGQFFDRFYAAWPQGADLAAAYRIALTTALTASSEQDGPSAALRRAGALINVGGP